MTPSSAGCLASGGLPFDFPTISLGEVFLSPTSLVFRNLMSMDVEEMIRAQPMSSVVLIGGCDKTGPAQVMGAVSAAVPAIQLVVGPMMTGRYRGERLGACTDCRRFWARHRSGEVTKPEIMEVEDNLAVTAGTCAVMGTASTMACLSEALGISLPGSAAVPAVHADRLRIAEASGAQAVRLAASGLTLNQIVTRESIENALRVLLAIGGSTNAVIHLAAIAGRVGLSVDLQHLNRLSESTPILVNLKPTGQHYMEDFHAAGGVGAVLQELKPLLHLTCRSVTGETLEERLDRRAGFVDRAVIRSMDEPVSASGGLLALFGNLAPNGSIIKCAAADERLFEHVGRAVVFKGLDDLAARIDDPDLDVHPDDALVLQNAGPIGAGMPEAGYLPIPAKLARAGVKDMLRISDARMSGTAFGTVILHVSPECAIGGPLGLVRSGDRIRVSVKERRLDVLVSEAGSGSAAFGGPAQARTARAGLRQALRGDGSRSGARMRLRVPASVSRRRHVKRAALHCRCTSTGVAPGMYIAGLVPHPALRAMYAAVPSAAMIAIPTSPESQMPRYSVSALPGCVFSEMPT